MGPGIQASIHTELRDLAFKQARNRVMAPEIWASMSEKWQLAFKQVLVRGMGPGSKQVLVRVMGPGIKASISQSNGPLKQAADGLQYVVIVLSVTTPCGIWATAISNNSFKLLLFCAT